jgi:hypothetical protein
MSNSYRIRTQVGVDKSIKLLIDQDFEQLEILSLKILTSQIYNRQCSDYGVIIGRISANNGFGLPNCKVSIFIPLSAEDENNPIISTLYPYKTLSDINEDGYRYNLLPYTPSYSAHVPTGTFPDREDALTDTTVIEVYDKYYKFTTQTNESGDYMIFGVPLGSQTIHVDVDLSDIGEFSLAPQDLIRLGIATEAQVAGTRFKASSNLGSLPQILSFNRTINVDPFWGQAEVCSIGITRTDFDITEEASIEITPTAIFMGSIFSDVDNLALKRNCKPKFAQGELCSLIAGPGEILAIRQTIFNDNQGKPVLEQFELDSGGQVIDDNGTWLLDVPMNLDYVTTNEFGERIFSTDPKIGIPTKGKYRFKIKWNQSPKLSENVKRAYFLVPNVREYGWQSSSSLTFPTLQKKSYAFSLDWNDYADPQTAINCEDTFYQFSYNKVYTVSQLIDQYRKGSLANRIISVKNILDNSCESDNQKFPTNDASFRWDFIYLLYTFAALVFRPILVALVFVIHVLFLVLLVLKVLLPLLAGYFFILSGINFIQAVGAFPAVGLIAGFASMGILWFALGTATTLAWRKLLQLELKGINLPLLLYDQCEFCDCDDAGSIQDDGQGDLNLPSIGQIIPPPVIPNASGIQITNMEGSPYNIDGIVDFPYLQNVGLLESGFFIQYTPNVVKCYSKTPFLNTGRYEITASDIVDCQYLTFYNYDVGESYDADFISTSLTLAERINLFNTKAKYFDADPIYNPGGGVNRVKVTVAPTINDPSTKYHFDNVVCMLMTPDSLPSLSAGTIMTFVDPNKSFDINFTGATLNEFGTNSITGQSYFHTVIQTLNPLATTMDINVNYRLPDNTGNQSVIYTIPPPSTADTNFHKFPTDVEYFQVITAMTYSQYSAMTVNQLPGNLNSRFLYNDMTVNVLVDKVYQLNLVKYFTPLNDLLEGSNQILVFLSRGVDPYSTRVMTRYGLGKLFGYNNEDDVIVTGMTKLNIPIQGEFKNVDHDVVNYSGGIVQAQDNYSSMYLYYNTYNYLPSITPVNGFSSFTSNNFSYYSSLKISSGFETWWPCVGASLNCNFPEGFSDSNYGFRVSNTIFPPSSIGGNDMLKDWNVLTPSSSPFPFPFVCSKTFAVNSSRNYQIGEIVEGGSLMFANVETTMLIDNNTGFPVEVLGYRSGGRTTAQYGNYVAPKYATSNFLTVTTGSSSRQLVMRSDRLPTSDRLLQNCGNYFALQQNQNFAMYLIPDEGALNVPSNTGGGGGTQTTEIDTPPPNFTAELLNSTNSCSNSRNLKCYSFQPNPLLPSNENPGGGRYILNSGSCQEYRNKKIFENGCYKLVTTIILSIPTDIGLVTEWLSRTSITFAACRNVFSHLFTHNWINGTLYAFAFKNNRVFDSNNNPSSEFCTDTIYLDSDTNNFYYRSSPYRTGTTEGFIGRNAPSGVKPNKKNLLFPTTIMDLGPRTDYLQELVFSDEYDGYVINQVKSTSFQDVSELLNLLIITRLANTKFISVMLGIKGANIFDYFTRVPKFSLDQRLSVDSDYAQMISINSEIGVLPFEAESYPSFPTPPLGLVQIDPVYFNSGNLEDVVFGIFYSSDTQVRDYLTPKRTIINDSVDFNNQCAFNNFYCYSQETPFYQWQLKVNSDLDTIFGSQTNDWWSDSVNGPLFHSSKYQSLDRGSNISRYFRTTTSSATRDKKGHIYSIDTRTVGSPFFTTPMLNPLPSSIDPNPYRDRVITVGAPFYFYFGLKKGKTAWDRFAKKWINFENITQ